MEVLRGGAPSYMHEDHRLDWPVLDPSLANGVSPGTEGSDQFSGKRAPMAVGTERHLVVVLTERPRLCIIGVDVGNNCRMKALN
jgi:hypothetical protein